jgi:hypothetical protein
MDHSGWQIQIGFDLGSTLLTAFVQPDRFQFEDLTIGFPLRFPTIPLFRGQFNAVARSGGRLTKVHAQAKPSHFQ